MASIITATTSNGLTHVADNSGVLQLASGTGNLVTVPSVTGTAMVSGNMPAFYAYQNSAQSIPNTTWTKVLFQVEEFDTNSNFASSRFTPTVAGYYQLTSQLQYTSIASGRNMFVIYKNGSEYRHMQDMQVSSTIGLMGTSLVSANGSSDYFEIYVYTSTGPYTLDNNSAITYFSGCLVRAA
jgi:hypothetical protein